MTSPRATVIVVLMAVLPAVAAIGYVIYAAFGWGGLVVAGAAAAIGLARVFAEALLTSVIGQLLPKRRPPP
jgi:hypothetical protein